jgi:2,5-diamino-6-(ribosylamino)-4(3H)-pyrimidinone 5'-phosphate reductase
MQETAPGEAPERSPRAARPRVVCHMVASIDGRLAWESNDIGGDHVVAVVSERVSDEYLALLRARGVSYLLAGARDVDLPSALGKIGAQLGLKTLMLEGGGRINGGMLRAGLVDEVSLLIAPVADGRSGTPALFHLEADTFAPRRLALAHVERRGGDVLWLRYCVAEGA